MVQKGLKVFINPMHTNSYNSRELLELIEEVNKINEGSTEYLEKLARERLGMIKPGEKVVNTKTVEKSNDKDQHNKSN